jgi:peroxiredoxin family protein
LPAPEKLSLIIYSGDAAKVHYALMMASSSVAIGKQATLFFTMEAVRSLAKPATGEAEELIQACKQLGATFMVCEAGLRATGLTRAQLRADLDLVECGIVTFLNDCVPGGQIVFI